MQTITIPTLQLICLHRYLRLYLSRRECILKVSSLFQFTLCSTIQKIPPNPNPQPTIISGCRLSRRFMPAIQMESSRIRMVFMRLLFACKRHGRMSALRFLISRNLKAIANAIRRRPPAFPNLLRDGVPSALS